MHRFLDIFPRNLFSLWRRNPRLKWKPPLNGRLYWWIWWYWWSQPSFLLSRFQSMGYLFCKQPPVPLLSVVWFVVKIIFLLVTSFLYPKIALWQLFHKLLQISQELDKAVCHFIYRLQCKVWKSLNKWLRSWRVAESNWKPELFHSVAICMSVTVLGSGSAKSLTAGVSPSLFQEGKETYSLFYFIFER